MTIWNPGPAAPRTRVIQPQVVDGSMCKLQQAVTITTRLKLGGQGGGIGPMPGIPMGVSAACSRVGQFGPEDHWTTGCSKEIATKCCSRTLPNPGGPTLYWHGRHPWISWRVWLAGRSWCLFHTKGWFQEFRSNFFSQERALQRTGHCSMAEQALCRDWGAL